MLFQGLLVEIHMCGKDAIMYGQMPDIFSNAF